MDSARTTLACGRTSGRVWCALALVAGCMSYAPYGFARCTGFEPSADGDNCRAGYTLRHVEKGRVAPAKSDGPVEAPGVSAIVASGSDSYRSGGAEGVTGLPVREEDRQRTMTAKDPSANYDGTTCEYFTRAADADHVNHYPENATVLYGDNVYTCTNGLWKYVRAASSYSAKARHRMDAIRIEAARMKSR